MQAASEQELERIGPGREAWATTLLESAEDALVDGSIAFAKRNGYAPYTTTIRAAWVEAVRSLTAAVGAYLTEADNAPGGPMADVDYGADPRFARMRLIARKHRALGITLQLYLGLFKHFRRVYIEALAPAPAAVLDRIRDFFDETELSVIADWTAAGDDQRLSELQGRARSLTLEKDRYVAIFESLRNPAFLLDRSGALIHANRAALEAFCAASEAGDGLYGAGRAALAARFGRLLEEALAPGADPEATIWLDTVAGRRCFDRRTLPLHDAVGNTALGRLLQLYDVTEHRDAAEKAQRAERQMSRFLATMSHEIRTPLHSVLGAAELLRAAESDAKAQYLDTIRSAGQSLLQTLNNVLDYSKLETGPPAPRPVDTELRPALDALCEMARFGPHAGRSALTLDVAADAPDHVAIDWAMTRQVLANLVANALRHDDGGGVSLHVRPARGGDGGGLSGGALRFEVRDHGPGLPQEEAEALAAGAADAPPRHTADGGAGLGLAISRHLVAAMGGRIGCADAPRGALVWVELPCAAASAAPEAATAQPLSAGPARRRCLVVDDDSMGALITVRQLESVGFEVDRRDSLAGGRAAAAERAYDVILLDHRLPDGEGPDLARELRRGGPSRAARFVALTANAEAIREARGGGDAFHAVLAKPTDSATLARATLGACVTARRLQGGAARHGLDGLSAATVAAMTEAFRAQWRAFRKQIAGARRGEPAPGLADAAHRLAGNTAQLGLTELTEPLRLLEKRLRAGSTDIGDLLARLDRPAERLASWRRLAEKASAP